MKLRFGILLAGWLGSGTLLAQTPEDDYVRIYNLIQQADSHRASGVTNAAIERYTDALRALQQFQTANPNWNEKVVRFRLNYISGHLNNLATPATIPAPAAGAGPVPTATATAADGNSQQLASQTAALVESQRIAHAFSNELVRAQSDNSRLNARLREALAVQSPIVDPRELTRAQARVISLQQENELLRTTLQQEQARAKTLVDPKELAGVQQSFADARNQLAKRNDELAALRAENEVLKRRAPAATVDVAQQLRERDDQISRLKDTVVALTSEKESLTRQLLSPTGTPAPGAGPGTDLAGAPGGPDGIPPSPAPVPGNGPGNDARIPRLERLLDERTTQLAEARRELDNFERDNFLLLATVKDISTRLSNQLAQPIEVVSAERRRREELEDEVIRLRADLGRANALPVSAARDAELQDLRARLAVLMDPPTPYGPQELALFAQPRIQLASLGTPILGTVATAADLEPIPTVTTPSPATPAATNRVTVPAGAPGTNPASVTPRKPTRNVPPGSGPLVAEAQRAFVANDLKTAEQKYLEVLRQDENNSFILGNLAAVYVEMSKLEEAEKYASRALRVDPDSAMNQFVTGLLRFRQQRYDDAVTALSRSIQLEPDRADAHLYLGTTFSQQGQRSLAEKELRKALQLNPNHPVAHYNLSVEYATQKPPAVALARWHYGKSLTYGHPPNVEVEKMLDWKKP